MQEVFISHSFDPFYNLAYEDCLFRNFSNDGKILFLYRNNPSVILGKFQNPWLESCPKNMAKDDIHLVRRQSGGGTVYHDLGNLNFCFMGMGKCIPKEDHLDIVLRALRNLGIVGERNKRNDLVISRGEQQFKFSGSAFKQSRERYLHHGTILIDSQLDHLWKYLHRQWAKVDTKSIPSVRSPVINLKSLRADLSIELVERELFKEFMGWPLKSSLENSLILDVSESSYVDFAKWTKVYEKFRHWDWIFGETPRFKVHLKDQNTSKITISLKAKRGCVEHISFDDLEIHPSLTVEIENSFKGLLLKTHLFEEKLRFFSGQYPMYEEVFESLIGSLKSEF